MKTIPARFFLAVTLAVLLLFMLTPGARGAVTLTTLYTFSNPTNGFRPNAGLVQGADGDLYGTTDKGGTSYSTSQSGGFGTVYKITTNGAFASLHSFSNGVDGGPHISELVQGTDGNLYGTTQYGGANSYGSIFSITTNGTFTTLFSFPLFRGAPQAPLLLGQDGNFYGTTRSGGSNYLGSVFRFTVTPSVTCTDLYSFQGPNDGYEPVAGLVQGTDGILYGTAQFGGSSNHGSIFGISTNGGAPVLLYLFQNGPDGAGPQGGLVQAPDGKLYGTASSQVGGGTGTVFSITTNGTFTTLHTFTGGTNGSLPFAGLTLGSDNKFYGIASGTSLTNSGTIYSIDTNGVFTVLFNFDYAEKTNGQVAASSPLIQGADGSFYGTTSYGGSSTNAGTVFRLSLSGGGGGTPPVITLQPPAALSNFTGGIALLSVAADNASAFQWFKSSSKVVNSSRISGATTSTLTISNLAAADAGIYHVVISNAFGATISSNSTLVVLIPDTTRPTVTIASPKTGQSVSNELFNATGTASDAGGVAAVFFQLNGGDWTNTTGATNWTAALTLTPGANTLRIYSVDTSTNFSTTNSVTFTYVLTAPVTVQIVGQGTVTPNLDGKLVAIGKIYSMSAKAAKGFKFQDWQIDGVVSNSAKLSFGGASNLLIVATFVDIARPVNAITFPAVNQTISNALFATSGRASDNVGVTSVWFHVNSWPWFPANTTNSWTNWSAPYFALLSGPDTVQAYAIDGAGNISLTNTVKFNYKVLPSPDWAPDSLNGLVGQAESSNNSPITVAFDPANFTQTGDGTNADDFGAGSYVYTKLATNLAELTITNYGPPPRTNVSSVSLIFTNHYSATFTNSDGDAGNLNLSIGTSFVPATLAKRTITAVDPVNTNTSTIKFLTDGTHFTQTSTKGGSSNGTFTFFRFSPIGALLSLNYSNGNYVQVQATFTSAKGGSYFAVINDAAGPPPILNAGTFTLK
jgi:uncharacterized repeat protein (TIGR03803 family)